MIVWFMMNFSKSAQQIQSRVDTLRMGTLRGNKCFSYMKGFRIPLDSFEARK